MASFNRSETNGNSKVNTIIDAIKARDDSDRRNLIERAWLNSIKGGWELIRTGIYSPGAGIGGKNLYYDDPKARQREAKSMSPKRREKLAKWYLRKVFEAEEKRLWLQKMLKK